MSKINLSTKQSEIVELGTGSYLVEASAGSGKTRVLTERVKNLLEDNSKKEMIIEEFAKIREKLGVFSASKKSAKIINKYLKK